MAATLGTRLRTALAQYAEQTIPWETFKQQVTQLALEADRAEAQASRAQEPVAMAADFGATVPVADASGTSQDQPYGYFCPSAGCGVGAFSSNQALGGRCPKCLQPGVRTPTQDFKEPA